MTIATILPLDAIINDTEKAWLIDFTDASEIVVTSGEYQVWLPKSKAQVDLVGGGFEIKVTMPSWICEMKGISIGVRAEADKVEMEEVDSIDEAFSELATAFGTTAAELSRVSSVIGRLGADFEIWPSTIDISKWGAGAVGSKFRWPKPDMEWTAKLPEVSPKWDSVRASEGQAGKYMETPPPSTHIKLRKEFYGRFD